MSKKGPDDDKLKFKEPDDKEPDDNEFFDAQEGPPEENTKEYPQQRSTSFADDKNVPQSSETEARGWFVPTLSNTAKFILDHGIAAAGGAFAFVVAGAAGAGAGTIAFSTAVVGATCRIVNNELTDSGNWRKKGVASGLSYVIRGAADAFIGAGASLGITTFAPIAGLATQAVSTVAVSVTAAQVLNKPLDRLAGMIADKTVEVVNKGTSWVNWGKKKMEQAYSDLSNSKGRIGRALIFGAAVAAVVAISIGSAGIAPAVIGVVGAVAYSGAEQKLAAAVSYGWKGIKSASQAISNTFSPVKEPVLAKSEDKTVASLKTPPLNDIDKSQAKTIGTEAAAKIAHGSTDSKPLANHQVTTKTTKDHGIVRS